MTHLVQDLSIKGLSGCEGTSDGPLRICATEVKEIVLLVGEAVRQDRDKSTFLTPMCHGEGEVSAKVPFGVQHPRRHRRSPFPWLQKLELCTLL